MLLRPESSGRFKVVGECYVHGVMNSEGLLGPLPDTWKVQVRFDAAGVNIKRYYCNSSTGVITPDDPRLHPLPPEWERIQAERTSDDPVHFAPFKNKITGEVINSDPRLLPEVLKMQGVDLKPFQLI
jgi:hypothetical protein